MQINYMAGNMKHGCANHPLYYRWKAMIKRCEDPKDYHYHRYGGRGIKVCERWHNIENYISDLGLPPSPLLTVDRINNDGDYEPSNVRWATQKQQAANRKSRAKMTYQDACEIRSSLSDGTAKAKELALKFGVTRNHIYNIAAMRCWN